MASKKILFISMEMSFLVDAIINNLDEANYEVISCKPDIKVLEDDLRKGDIVILYLGKMTDITREALIYIKDGCIEESKSLYLLGSKEEIAEMHSIFPEDMIQKEFERPINVKDLIKEFEHELNYNKKPNILIVDDDSVYLRTVHEWLHEKYHLTMVNSGMNAITYLAKHTPDLILLDYEMPIADGPQILEMIRSEKSTKDTPVMFLTGQNNRENVENVIRLKPAGYLLKSMKPWELIRAIDNFFKKQRM